MVRFMTDKLKLPFDPTHDVFRWGPVPGKFLYVSIFTEVHYKHFRSKYEENWSETFFLFRNGRMFWVNNAKEIAASGGKVFVRYMLPQTAREHVYREWRGYVEKMEELENQINETNLSAISDNQLLELWNTFNETYINFWVTGSVPELSNYGSVEYLDEKLQSYIPDPNERASALSILTAPTKLSFYQEEEIDLSKSENMEAHQKQYFWLKNSYAGTEVLPVSFFAERKKSLASTLEKDIIRKLAEHETAKETVRKKYTLPKEIMDIARAICDGICWQDERKKYIFIILHYTDRLLHEVARRFSYAKNDFDNLWYFEIAQIIEGADLRELIQDRARGFGVQFFHTCKELTPEETAYVWDIYEAGGVTQITGHANSSLDSELKGIVACKGNGEKISGRIHILLDPTKADQFKEGEILVAPMTSPEYIFAMRKASAVLTDTGGLTSHAAIVSRELGIPCIVGTKSATKLFKDGDVVEIDPDVGAVKKV